MSSGTSATMGTLSGVETICQSCCQSILVPLLVRFAGQNHLRWPGDTAVFPDSPEMHDHEDAGNDGNRDAMPDVGAQQRIRVHDRAAQQSEADVVVRRHAQLTAEWALAAQQWGGLGHAGA